MTPNALLEKQQKVAEIDHGAMDVRLEVAAHRFTLASKNFQLLLKQVESLTQLHGQVEQLVVGQLVQFSSGDVDIQHLRLKRATRQHSESRSRTISHSNSREEPGKRALRIGATKE